MQYPNIAQPQYAFAPTMMAKGGLASAAQNVQAQGRNGDSMLVHMTPGEVGGLQALAMQHGGSLSINPNTGLPEAGFLKNLLPTLIGAGLMMVPGLQGVGAGYIGAGVGAVEALRTGDLGKGFLAGLGAFGGANLAGGLQAAGTQAAGLTSGAEALGTTSQAISTPEGIAQALGADATGTLNPQLVDKFATGVQTGTAQAATTPFQTTASGIKNVFASGPQGQGARAAFMNEVGGVSGLAQDVGMIAAPMLSMTPEPTEMPTGDGKPVPQYTQSRGGPRFPSNEQIRTDSSEFTYFDAPQYSRVNPPAPIETASSGTSFTSDTADFLNKSTIDKYRDDEERRRNEVPIYTMRAAEGGLARLKTGGSVPTLEDGGFVLTKKAVDGLGRGNNKKGQKVASRGLGAIPIKGPGTGTSDSIKTTIDNKRPALVSNGEAYVPKKQVAKKGGAKAFYALMSKAEKAAEKRKRA